MDAEFKKLLAGDSWAATGDREDPTAVSGVTRADGWSVAFSSTEAPPRTLFNQIFRELYGGAKELSLGISQYDSDVSYPVGAVCQVNGRLFYANQASNSSNPVNPVTLNNTHWEEMGGVGEIPTRPDAIPVGDIFIDGSLADRFAVYWAEPANGNSPILSTDLRYSKNSSFPAADTTTESDYQAGTPITITARDSDLYYVSLRFNNAVSDSLNNALWSAPKKVAASALTPDAVTGLQATGNIGTGLVDLNWGAPYARGLSITDYLVEWKSGAQNYDSTRQATPTTTSYQVTGLTDDTLYTFRVTARSNRSTNSPVSVEVTATPEANPDIPDTPSIAASAVGYDEVQAYVSALPADNNATITNFQWDLKRSGDNWSTPSAITTKRTQETIVSFDGLIAGQAYDIRCRAYNGVGDTDSDPATGSTGYSAYSSDADVSTLSFASPDQPDLYVRWGGVGNQGAFAYYGLDGNINDTGGSDVVTFNVEYKESTANTWTSVATDASSPSGIIINLDPEKSYNVRIQATNSGSLDSPWSAEGTLEAYATVPNKPTVIVVEGEIQYQSGGGPDSLARHTYSTMTTPYDGGKPVTRWQFQSTELSSGGRAGNVYTYLWPIGTTGFTRRNRTLRIWGRVYNGVGDADNDPTTGSAGWSEWSDEARITIT